MASGEDAAAVDPRTTKLHFTLKELSLSARSEAATPGGSSLVELRSKKLVCVEYPGMVASVERMLETLGGEQTVTKTFSDPSRRLELRFRPQDPFCHAVCGNRLPSSNVLLRVRRRVRKKDPKDAQIQMDILGIIGTTYKFQGMADFQCLAVDSKDGNNTSLYDKIILRKAENQAFFERDVPYFLPPAIFSRLDSPIDYHYRPDVINKLSSSLPLSTCKNFIGLNRPRRPHNAIFVSFNDPTIPHECLEAARVNWGRLSLKEMDKQAEEKVKKMFESRPIWSGSALKANLDIHRDKLKLLLPVYAYYMVTGPWRTLWIRLGYDPRKNAEAKKYQILDFRIRVSFKHGNTLPVKAKRSTLISRLPTTFNKTAPPSASLMDIPAPEAPSTSLPSAQVSYQLKESAYIFREGMLPPHRQMFYQLCDLEVDSIKEVINQNNGQEQVCDERDGWCVVGTTDKLRDIMSAMIKNVAKEKQQEMPESFPKRRKGTVKDGDNEAEGDEEEEEGDEECENKEDEEENEEDEFQPSEGSENEMETDMLDYM
ncbi:general transcription factor 3C polypeptide 5 isoform X1 [Cyprinodon tularosa]|uniref:general transcription factor 3C polypeptide 5 isoform X1 n=1 Tax=Cyprinodon tularosa TaxID=77115 RepID=UPI0018E27FE3|nr:general transcription factor 3C polypeptide 5 isoform X1 [Cyprinodon tularosa]